MFSVNNYISNLDKYQKVAENIIKSNNSCLLNSSTNIQKLIITDLFHKTHKTIIVVYPNIYQATIAYSDYLLLTEAENISFFPVEDLVASELIATGNTYRLERIKTIYKLLNNIPQIVITSTDGLIRNLMNVDALKKAIFDLSVNDTISRDKLIENLVNRGYQKVSYVESAGTFSVRGSIVDIYSINTKKPCRIEFFDDEIESIKLFDVSTQRSTKKLNNIAIYPFYDIYYSQEEIKNIKERIKQDYVDEERLEKLFNQIDNYTNLDLLYLYLPYFDPHYDFFTNLVFDKYLVFSNLTQILEKENILMQELNKYCEESKIIVKKDFFPNILNIIQNNNKNVIFENFGVKNNDVAIDYLTDLRTSNNIDYNNYLLHMIDEYKVNPKTYVITHYDDAKLKLITDLLDSNNCQYHNCSLDNKVTKGDINILVSDNALGFIDYELNLEIITPKEYAKGKIYRLKKDSQYETLDIYSKEDLMIGDYVVHIDYGIGRYQGIKTIENKGIKKDYLTIEYADTGRLYVPVDKIDRIKKYLSSFDKVPNLNKINGKEWTKKKAKIKEKLEKIAKDLIQIQAQRAMQEGFVYKKDSDMQQFVENDFAFDETIDQIRAINEVKKDMESNYPVDRLICGDVGFGKTEVALRAAFKAVDNGMQVAILAPTTILSRQHYYTFKERLEKYGVRVELLNRFTQPKQVKNILEGLKSGYVDILIGTHRILSDDIIFKKLGMLVIDEEQRFGVAIKEKIKAIKANIDILYLSATPIPRTLQMSLSGLRDMSLIETPPINRKSIQTYVLKYSEAVIREAIYREMSRNGQVFYLLNKIEKLDLIKTKIEKLVPFAKTCIIHGQMDKEDIENVLTDFLDYKYDVLVCTTIIETGMDIPNVNTLIIEQADHLGLAQLYQIRGRVGRSDELAYAYLMYDNESKLTDVAKKRLNAIKEFTTLGSGYKIAMRDLSIRGAGDILGSEQSGFIDDIGIDLYIEMLDEAIQAEKGIKTIEKEEIQYDLLLPKTVDNKYVDDDVVKIAIHEEINKIYSKEEAINVEKDFIDRFGKLSNELKVYIYSKYLETLLKQNDIEQYKKLESSILLVFSETRSEKIKNIIESKIQSINKTWVLMDLNRYSRRYKTSFYKAKLAITIPIKKEDENNYSYIYDIINFFELLN